MSSLRLPWLVAATVFVFCFKEPAAVATVVDDVPAAIQQILAAGGAGPATDAAALKTFYEQRNYLPVWIDSAGTGARAQSLLQGLRQAGRDGLEPADYDPGALAAAGAADAATLASADVALNGILLRYASDVSRGRTLASKAGPMQSFTPKPFDPLQVLNNAAAAPDPGGYVQSLSPTSPLYLGLRESLDRHRALAAAGGWPSLPDGPTLVPGAVDERVSALRARLQVSGDLAGAPSARSSTHYDDDVRNAVIRFQQRHGLAPDGSVGPQTREALNVSVEARIRQLLANLERVRWLPEDLGDTHVLVNVPAFDLAVVQGGLTVMQMRVIVGRPSRATPIFSSEIVEVEVNPFWYVPPTILREDKLPILRSNPGALASQGIRVIGADGTQLDPRLIDWSQVSANRFPYKLRQDPGERNALGRIKFTLPNPYDVYLHDTPQRALFQQSARALSSGCVRVERPVDLAEFLLAGDWGRERIERAVASRRHQYIAVAKPVPVHLVYITAWRDQAGLVHFRNDLYNLDGQSQARLARRLP